MRPAELETYRLHAGLSSYQRRESKLLKFLADNIDHKTVVAFSAGKDSSVAAHAAHSVAPHIPILMVDPGCPTHWTANERDQWLDYAHDIGWDLKLFAWDKWGDVAGAKSVTQHQRMAHSGMFRDLHRWMSRFSYDCTITGMRAQESRGRLMHRRVHGQVFQSRDGKRWLMPLADWRTTDIWAYIVKHGLPWLGIYDLMGAGARNGILGRSGDRFGRGQNIHRHYPEYLSLARELMPDLF